MASSGLQLFGFILALVGLAATVAATFLVEWKKKTQGSSSHIYEGLWETCIYEEKTICDSHESLFKLPTEVQATRAVMLISILLSIVSVLVSIIGMKCTHFMDSKPGTKATTAMIGGIIFMISGLLTTIITSWYVTMIVEDFHASHHLQNSEFGQAVFVSWAGGVLSMAGGAFLTCRRCKRSGSSESISANHLFPNSNQTSNYV